MIYF
jgi:hypothetical protein